MKIWKTKAERRLKEIKTYEQVFNKISTFLIQLQPAITIPIKRNIIFPLDEKCFVDLLFTRFMILSTSKKRHFFFVVQSSECFNDSLLYA